MVIKSPTRVIDQAEILAQSLIADGDVTVPPAPPTADASITYWAKTFGECYAHGQGVARILNRWQADHALQAAGLLHSLVWHNGLGFEQVEAACGRRAAFLLREYCRILKYPVPTSARGRPEAIRRVKLYVATHRDPALAFLGVASLWEHFTVAQGKKSSINRGFLNEAQNVLIPMLDVLGMWDLKQKVEKWVVQHGPNWQFYQQLMDAIKQNEDTRRQAFETIADTLRRRFPAAQIGPKPFIPRTIYNPAYVDQLPTIEALQHKLKIDVLVDDEESCYVILGYIHRLWPPPDGSRITDYIANGKLNGYRCLQTKVNFALGASVLHVYFHIRTWEMDEINRWGLAALELRKQDAPSRTKKTWWETRKDAYPKIHSAEIGSLPDTLHVFSPQGELFSFARGSTVVDYAYQVHSSVAHQCKRFRVNGEVVNPTTVLRHLDLVELERDPQFLGPTEAWLNAARTERARSSIRRFLKQRKQLPHRGRTILNQRLRTLEEYYRINIPNHRVEQALGQATRQSNYDRVEDLLTEIAAGRLTSERFLYPLFADEVLRQVQLPVDLRLRTNQLRLAQCCKPRPGDAIIGHPRTRNDTVAHLKIHRDNCTRVTSLAGNLALSWRPQPALNTVVRLEVAALDEDGLVGDALAVIYANRPNLTLHKVDCIGRGGVAHMNFTIEAKDQEVIEKVAEDITRLPGHTINTVRQMQLLFSEKEELARPITTISSNPYRRLPVRDREMFFGRTEELAHCYDYLQAGVGAIFLRGQKRMGKTSLLVHLKEHYLDRASIEPVLIDFQILSHMSGPTFYFEIANTVYNELRRDTRINQIGAPLRELFEVSPTSQLIDYLKGVQTSLEANQLVLLIDEFSRTIDAFQRNPADDNVFQQWRGILHATLPEISYVMVIQQQTYDTLLAQMDHSRLEPIWHLLEMGEPIMLKPLDKKDARQLIERPTRNYFEYSPEAIEYVWRLTGGSPFLIQAFCFNLVRSSSRANRRRIDRADVEALQVEFMHPNESLFAHLLDLIQGVGNQVCHCLAQLLYDSDQPVSFATLQDSLPEIPEGRLRNTLQTLTNQDVLIEPGPGHWQFASLLFGRWLAYNTIPNP